MIAPDRLLPFTVGVTDRQMVQVNGRDWLRCKSWMAAHQMCAIMNGAVELMAEDQQGRGETPDLVRLGDEMAITADRMTAEAEGRQP